MQYLHLRLSAYIFTCVLLDLFKVICTHSGAQTCFSHLLVSNANSDD